MYLYKWGSYFSLMACEDCLEVCFVELVVGRICIRCLVIAVIFMGFGQAGVKRWGGCLKVINWGWRCKSQREGRFSECNTAVLWNFIALSFIGFYWIPLFTILLLFYVFEVGKAESTTQSVLMILTLNGLFQKNCLLYHWKLQTKQSFTPRNST